MLHARPFAPVAVAAVLVAAAGCGSTSTPSSAAEPNPPSESGGQVADAKGAKITLKASGPGKAIVNYTFGDKTGQKSNAKLPWTLEGKHNGDDAAVYLVSVTAGAAGGPVGCRILVNGKEAKAGKGEGQYASADCSITGFDIR